jgi:hypothetical protein
MDLAWPRQCSQLRCKAVSATLSPRWTSRTDWLNVNLWTLSSILRYGSDLLLLFTAVVLFTVPRDKLVNEERYYYNQALPCNPIIILVLSPGSGQNTQIRTFIYCYLITNPNVWLIVHTLIACSVESFGEILPFLSFFFNAIQISYVVIPGP